MHTNEEIEEKKIDLVCGMHLASFPGVITHSYEGRQFYFCGEGCFERFKKNPKKFMGVPLIHIDGVWKIFKSDEVETQVLKELDVHIWEGDFVSIIGASGSGKSTLLNMMGLLDKPTSGKVYLRGSDISALGDDESALLRSETFGFVFQQYNLIPWLTAHENVTVPRIFAARKTDAEKVREQFKAMGLEERMNHRPSQLSGGEQQRVAILRALSNDPAILLCDEPTGNLDSNTGNKLLEMLIEFNRVQKKTLVIVTHDKDIAEKADEIITLKDGALVPDHHVHKAMYTE